MSKNSVQCLGLPGSGKTTILRALAEAFPDRYELPPTFSPMRRVFLSFLFVCRFPLATILFFSLLLRNRVSLWRYLGHLLSLSFATHMYARIRSSRRRKVLLIDEGLLQRLLSVTSIPLSLSSAQKMVYRLPGDSWVLAVKGGDFDRFLNQPDRMINPRNKLGEAYVKAWTVTLSHNFDMITIALKVREECIEIDNTAREHPSHLAGNIDAILQGAAVD